ncbi:uncharacterized protein FOMMEDRAFT_165822 [Fomitiporia mediterranea MF3/22]|uniref:uncharacterized protein n=1 Tax=Fomitiporia mediterranea (strain MF3/22) TaxID=694068 RepID=UPI0004408B25|nr:uncharacterized protein FOMMEDRAFT_165822 [Fomitiporia mediterranea MF3/22]EJD05377.1 hypothetical protein FOMMEDRAFT_165822 [Fomitiporia mediterranea MF3/22]
MAYVAHPYAAASASSSTTASTITRHKRPTITTPSISPSSFLDATSPTRSPSPIVFARASVVFPHPSASTCGNHPEFATAREKEKEKRDRRRGLMAKERVVHAGLDALLRAPEAAPRSAPKPRAPHLVRSPTSFSVAPVIEHSECSSTTRKSCDSVRSGRSSAGSPTPSSGSGSAPSTPGQPRTPVSIEFDAGYTYPSIPPLTICKMNRTPSPSPPVKHLSSYVPSPTAKTTENDPIARANKRRSRRFSARMATAARVEQVFAPLEIDTAAARSLDLSLESPRGKPTLTGVLAELEREAEAIPPVPSLTAATMPNKQEDNDAESEWLDIEDDPLADAEFYRADIASHLQLFSSSYSFPPTTRKSSYSRHQRNGSSSSSVSHWQLPPARPDSLPPPPHFLPSLPEPATDFAAPVLSSEQTQYSSLRRASASSLASTNSGRSVRSTGSASGKSKRRGSRNSRHSIARRSAAVGIGRRRNSGILGGTRPSRTTKEKQQRRPGPSALLDPTFMEVEETVECTRPPPRFSMPVSIDDDVFDDDVAVIGTRANNGMGKLVEEDEDDDYLLDPFLLDKFPVINASSSAPQEEVVDPFTMPIRTADVPISPSSFSPLSPSPQSHLEPQPFLLVPDSPSAPSFPKSGSSTGTFDAESLYSSYAAMSPPPSTDYSGASDSSSIRKTSASSIYCDASGRPLQSRWSVSTFASTVPATASSSRSFFPKLTTVPSRLSARLKAARERAMQQAREREEREKEKPAVVRPYPFFPTPQPVEPKRKAPGPYVPKPELMPASQRAKLATESSNASTVTSLRSPRTSSSRGSSRNSSETDGTCVPSPPPKDRPDGKERVKYVESPAYKTQFAQYHTHKHSPAHAAHATPSPSRSVKSRNGSTDSLSAFPFTLGGERLSLSGSRASSEATRERTISGGSDTSSGLRRKPIPVELFSRA